MIEIFTGMIEIFTGMIEIFFENIKKVEFSGKPPEKKVTSAMQGISRRRYVKFEFPICLRAGA